MQQPLRAQIVGVGIAGALAAQHANAASGARSLAGRFHNLLVHAQRRRRNRLKVKVGVVAAGAQRLAQAALQQPLGDAEFLKKVALMARIVGKFPDVVIVIPVYAARVCLAAAQTARELVPQFPLSLHSGTAVCFRPPNLSRARIRPMKKLLAAALLLDGVRKPGVRRRGHHHHHHHHHHRHTPKRADSASCRLAGCSWYWSQQFACHQIRARFGHEEAACATATGAFASPAFAVTPASSLPSDYQYTAPSVKHPASAAPAHRLACLRKSLDLHYLHAARAADASHHSLPPIVVTFCHGRIDDLRYPIGVSALPQRSAAPRRAH